MNLGNNWTKIRTIFNDAFNSCLHYALTTANEDGSPHVTPIGALVLREDRTGFYFDEYCTKTRQNLERDPRICLLAVNAGREFWGKSLATGKFPDPPAVRLTGTAGEIREATEDEKEIWKSKISYARGTKGYETLWNNMHLVRDLKFESFEPVEMGEMTAGLWEQV
jgi:general stress protein 26